MMPRTNNILGICLAVLLCICSTYEEFFLTWNITDTSVNNSTEIHFTQDSFTRFYTCLCNQFSRQCILYIDGGNFVKAHGQSVAANFKLQPNRYECLPEVQKATILRPVTCTKVDPIDKNIIYSRSQYCTRYSVNESLLGIICELTSVELSTTTNFSISPTSNGDGVNVSSCAVESSSSSPTTTSLPSLTTMSPSSSSGLTKEHIVIIGLALGIVIIISALVILGIILWRRRQNSRDNIISKAPTIHMSQYENDNGIVNHGGDFSLEDEITDPYYTSKSPKASDVEASTLTGPYTTIDVDMATVKFTTAAVKSKNQSSIKLDESAKHHLPSGSENPYTEPKVMADANPMADSDKTMWKMTNLSKKSKNENNHKPAADANMKGAPSASSDVYSKPETDSVTETYAVVKPGTKLNRGSSTNAASSPNKMENKDLDDVKVLYHAPSSKYGNSNLNVHSSPDSGCVLTKDVDKGMPGGSKLYYASTDIVNSDFNSDQPKPQDTHEYFILERNYESSDCSESEEV